MYFINSQQHTTHKKKKKKTDKNDAYIKKNV